MKERIKAIRKDCGLTQAEFAAKLGISKGNIVNYECKGKTPSAAGIQNICRTFCINEHWLLTGEGEMKAPPSRESEIAEITAMLFNEPEDSFRSKVVKLAMQMTPEQMDMVQEIINKLK